MAETRTYYGTKRVEAWPSLPPNSDGVGPAGYAIRYPGGHESWSPKDVFEAAYSPADRMGFEGALAAMREGRKVRRHGIDAEHVSIWLDGDTFRCQRAGAVGENGQRAQALVGVWHPNALSLLADWLVVG